MINKKLTTETLKDEDFINKVKEILLTQKEEISSKKVEREIDYDGDEVDIIQAKILARVVSELSSRDKENLLKIENSLKKIEDGSFGSCDECNENISQKRLIFDPKFANCISCAEEIEINKKRGIR